MNNYYKNFIKEETEKFETWNQYKSYANWFIKIFSPSFDEIIEISAYLTKLAKKRHINID